MPILLQDEFFLVMRVQILGTNLIAADSIHYGYSSHRFLIRNGFIGNVVLDSLKFKKIFELLFSVLECSLYRQSHVDVHKPVRALW